MVEYRTEILEYGDGFHTEPTRTYDSFDEWARVNNDTDLEQVWFMSNCPHVVEYDGCLLRFVQRYVLGYDLDRSCPVINLDTKVRYSSMGEACHDMELSISSMSHSFNRPSYKKRGYITCGGYRWRKDDGD